MIGSNVLVEYWEGLRQVFSSRVNRSRFTSTVKTLVQYGYELLDKDYRRHHWAWLPVVLNGFELNLNAGMLYILAKEHDFIGMIPTEDRTYYLLVPGNPGILASRMKPAKGVLDMDIEAMALVLPSLDLLEKYKIIDRPLTEVSGSLRPFMGGKFTFPTKGCVCHVGNNGLLMYVVPKPPMVAYWFLPTTYALKHLRP